MDSRYASNTPLSDLGPACTMVRAFVLHWCVTWYWDSLHWSITYIDHLSLEPAWTPKRDRVKCLGARSDLLHCLIRARSAPRSKFGYWARAAQIGCWCRGRRSCCRCSCTRRTVRSTIELCLVYSVHRELEWRSSRPGSVWVWDADGLPDSLPPVTEYVDDSRLAQLDLVEIPTQVQWITGATILNRVCLDLVMLNDFRIWPESARRLL